MGDIISEGLVFELRIKGEELAMQRQTGGGEEWCMGDKSREGVHRKRTPMLERGLVTARKKNKVRVTERSE